LISHFTVPKYSPTQKDKRDMINSTLLWTISC